MKTSRHPKRRAMILIMAAALILPVFGAPFTGQANPLANDATVLNYLIEMERQTGKGCNNETIELPSLIPTSQIQELADILATSNTTLDELLTLRGMDRASTFSAFVHANTPQEAVQKLRLANCQELLNARYTQIGSNHHGTKWTIILAGEQRIPAEQSSDIIVNPYEPSEAPASVTPQSATSGSASSGAATAPGLTPPSDNPMSQNPMNQTPTGQEQAARQTHGKYSDGEPVFLPEKDEYRDPATPQVTGVYTDDTLSPVPNGQQQTPPAVTPGTRQPQPVQEAPVLRQEQPVRQQPQQSAMQQSQQPSGTQGEQAAPPAPRKTFGKYADGEPVFLPEQGEHREPATPQVTGVYTDDTLTPQTIENQPAPAAPLAPLPDYPESGRDPNDAAPPQVTGTYTP